MHQRRRERMARARGEKVAGRAVPAMEPCPRCTGKGQGCPACDGVGMVKASEAGTECRPTPEQEPPEVEVLMAWSGIERYGVAGWIELVRSCHGNPRLQPHPDLMEALAIVDGELARLEEEDLGR